MKFKVAVIIPCYNVRKQILKVIRKINFSKINFVYIVDDACPQGSSDYLKKKTKNKKIKIFKLKKNLGVGGATIFGFKKALKDKNDIIIKMDGDGQHNPNDLDKFIKNLKSNKFDYCKGIRINSFLNLQNMPFVRFYGNLILTNFTRYITGFKKISDCLNGFIGIKSQHLKKIKLNKLKKDYFFEQDLLFHLSFIKTNILELPIRITYLNETSNINLLKVIPTFTFYHLFNFLIKINYIIFKYEKN